MSIRLIAYPDASVQELLRVTGTQRGFVCVTY